MTIQLMSRMVMKRGLWLAGQQADKCTVCHLDVCDVIRAGKQ